MVHLRLSLSKVDEIKSKFNIGCRSKSSNKRTASKKKVKGRNFSCQTYIYIFLARTLISSARRLAFGGQKKAFTMTNRVTVLSKDNFHNR